MFGLVTLMTRPLMHAVVDEDSTLPTQSARVHLPVEDRVQPVAAVTALLLLVGLLQGQRQAGRQRALQGGPREAAASVWSACSTRRPPPKTGDDAADTHDAETHDSDHRAEARVDAAT